MKVNTTIAMFAAYFGVLAVGVTIILVCLDPGSIPHITATVGTACLATLAGGVTRRFFEYTDREDKR